MNRRRGYSSNTEEEPPIKKGGSQSVCAPTIDLKKGAILKDVTGNKWILGKTIGLGGFGEIFSASDQKGNINYVAKVEEHENGPLFVEINCYLRIARAEMIKQWMKKKQLKRLGMPQYEASGSHIYQGKKYRFLILPKFDKDLEQIMDERKIINLKTVLTISCQILDVLEYIHEKGYIHSDIKASNILLGCEKCTNNKSEKYTRNLRPLKDKRFIKTDLGYQKRKLRPNKNINYTEKSDEVEIQIEQDEMERSNCSNQVYLSDYGLASKYVLSNGQLKEFCEDERRAHAGTVLFCSCDAHKGVISRRSDLESLGYNIIYWLTGDLPWINDVDDPELVAKYKRKLLLKNPQILLNVAFNKDYPEFLLDYFRYLNNLKFQDRPDYEYCKRLFKNTIKQYGYQDDSILDFSNCCDWKLKGKIIKNGKSDRENLNVIGKIAHQLPRIPLQSNIPRVVLRKAKKVKQTWSKILVDPETIIKQRSKAKCEVLKETAINISDLDISSLNPTYAMIDVVKRYTERNGCLPTTERGDFSDFLPGYTPAMMEIYRTMMERKELETLKFDYGKNGKNKKINRKHKVTSTYKVPSKTKSLRSLIPKKDIPTRKVKSLHATRNYTLRG